jgi:hypothetical protein
MHYSTILFGLLPAVALAAPSLSARQQYTPEDIANAVIQWQQDTGIVSQFLDNAAFFSPSDLLAQAQNALNFENDELNHKAVLDFVFVNIDPNVNNANNILVGEGKFADVVNLLQDMAINGNIGDVKLINDNRCANVLPAIDAYFAAAVAAGFLGDSGAVTAIRPLACQ